MNNPILETTLKKKIDDVIYDLMIKTSANMVYLDDDTALDVKLAKMLQDISDAKSTLAELVGDGTAGSITSQIETAVKAAVDAINDETDETSLAGKIKAINDATTGILAQAKKYTDDMKDTIVSELSGAFHFKGKVNYVDQLPADGVAEGDVYQVQYQGTSESPVLGDNDQPVGLDAEYCWNGTDWVELGSIVDLSAYSTTTQMNEAIETAKTEAVTEANAALQTEVGNINTALGQKSRILVSATQPEDLTEADLWLKIEETANEG